ncbi:unnamed protein product [Bubo scandiacus]
MEELQIEMKETKRDFVEKLLDACGEKEMLDMEKQQMTVEKQELASKVSHRMERLKEDLEGIKKEMASGSSSLPAASLPGTAGNIQPPPPIHYQGLFLETAHQLLCS